MNRFHLNKKLCGDGWHARRLAESVLDLVYPIRCPVCGDPAPFGARICPECRSKLPLIETKRCARCGKPVEDFKTLCSDCEKTEHLYDRGLGVFIYDTTMRRAMSGLKYKGRKEYGKVFGELLYEHARSELMLWEPDCLIPIPLYPERERERGYNQAAVIAESLSEKCHIPVRQDILYRTLKTSRMKELTAKERADNMALAFSVSAGTDGIKRTVLIDDIYTTGSTIDAAAGALRQAGIREIYFLAVCIGAGFMVSY